MSENYQLLGWQTENDEINPRNLCYVFMFIVAPRKTTNRSLTREHGVLGMCLLLIKDMINAIARQVVKFYENVNIRKDTNT